MERKGMCPKEKATALRDTYGADHACHLCYRYRSGHEHLSQSWTFWNSVIRILEAEKKAMQSTAAERRKRRKIKEQKRRNRDVDASKNE